MAKKILKIDVLRGKIHNKTESQSEIGGFDVIDKTKVSVDLGLDGELNETSDSGEKQYSGKNLGDKAYANDNSTSSDNNTSVGITVSQMVKETENAIKQELEMLEREIKNYKKNQNVSVFDFNNKIKRLRFLNQILYNLKHLFRATEDYIINLWKQFVKKN